MKKYFAIPAIAVLAAAGAASAAGFAGGVSSAPLQVGQTNDLECATSAEIIEWGWNDHLAGGDVDTARVQLNGAQCSDQAVGVIWVREDGSAYDGPAGNYRAHARVKPQPAGTQYVRVTFNQPVPAAALDNVRVYVEPGYSGLAYGNIG